jgi:hypothetical protein
VVDISWIAALKLWLLYGFAAVGVILTLALVAGIVVDVATFDETSGGYEPPYTDYEGEPIDWDTETYTTQTGMVKPGYVVDFHLDCTSGMIRLEFLNLVTVDYREVSDRAIAVHQPQDACRERGFDPQFDEN